MLLKFAGSASDINKFRVRRSMSANTNYPHGTHRRGLENSSGLGHSNSRAQPSYCDANSATLPRQFACPGPFPLQSMITRLHISSAS